MNKIQLTKAEIHQYSLDILNSAKYRSIDIPLEILENLYQQELPFHKRLTDLHKSVRKKLHNIVAGYLGDVDYDQVRRELENAFDHGEEEIKTTCLKILQTHISTRERTPILEQFYHEIFSRTGKPKSILDLACGYHPFGLPWMNLNHDCNYYAYDIIKKRIDLINLFFGLSGRSQLAFQEDILLHPPSVEADLAFFFKEAHRFEQRQKGCNRAFWQSLNVKHLLVSLPSNSMNLRHDKTDQHRRLVYETIEGLNWTVEEFKIANELLFWIRK
jgi:16S rRNA (guanine(1405)-N(7))-methyltransferase